MPEDPEPSLQRTAAPRIKRPSWKDPRLALGAVLVIASVIGTVFLVRALNETTAVYVAGADITLGEQLTTENLRVQEVQLGDAVENYALAGSVDLDVARANTFISAGELIPLSSITASNLGSRRPINLELPSDLSEAITPGSFVDVWVAQKDAGANTYAVPEQLATMVEVSARVARTGNLVGANGTNLELLVETDALEQLLQALANDARITVIYNPAGEQL